MSNIDVCGCCPVSLFCLGGSGYIVRRAVCSLCAQSLVVVFVDTPTMRDTLRVIHISGKALTLFPEETQVYICPGTVPAIPKPVRIVCSACAEHRRERQQVLLQRRVGTGGGNHE